MIALGFVVWAFAGRDDGRPAGAQPGRFLFIGGDGLTPDTRLYTMNADGSDLRTIPTGDLFLMSAAPSPDGERIATMASDPWPTARDRTASCSSWTPTAPVSTRSERVPKTKGAKV